MFYEVSGNKMRPEFCVNNMVTCREITSCTEIRIGGQMMQRICKESMTKMHANVKKQYEKPHGHKQKTCFFKKVLQRD